MKSIFTTLLFLLTTFFFYSCQKDDDIAGSSNETEGSVVNALDSFLAIDSLTISSTYINTNSNYEFGLMMTFDVSGKITDLGVKMPDSADYQVTLWDLSDTSIVSTVTITADSGIATYKEITTINVNAGDRYSVTVYANDYYYYEYPNVQDIYPLDLGDITIDGYAYQTLSTKSNTVSDFPDSPQTDYYAGVADFKFIKSE